MFLNKTHLNTKNNNNNLQWKKKTYQYGIFQYGILIRNCVANNLCAALNYFDTISMIEQFFWIMVY